MSNPVTQGNRNPGAQDAFKPPKLTVTFGKVVDNPNYNGPAPETGQVFLDLMMNSRYEQDGHRYMAGVSSPAGFAGMTAAFFQLAAPTLLWICDWTVAQFNTEPEVPDPFSVGDQWVLLDLHVEPPMMGLAPDGISPLRRISGTYVFGNKYAGDMSSYTTSAFAIAQWPRPQWMADTFQRTIPASSLKSDLITQNVNQRAKPAPRGPAPRAE